MRTNRYEDAAKARLEGIVKSKEATILAIETSCDETAAAVVRNGRHVLSNAVYSQIPLHERYGGVVPEIASRNHVEKLRQIVEIAMREANCTFADLDAIAVTAHPGLVGALLTGVSYAKGLAYACSLPLIGVDHIAGHIAANYICHPALKPPFVALVASGSHSHLFRVETYTRYMLLGRTRDDAAGEAFDKVARVLGLGYPGGPKLERLAKEGDPGAVRLPIGIHTDGGLDFSFSGLKTAIINYLHTARQRNMEICPADVAASFQYSLVASLADNAVRAVRQEQAKAFVLSGGVAANGALVARLCADMEAEHVSFFAPTAGYTGDNAAMIACAGYFALCEGARDGLDLNALARNIY